jgi:hypothetical protein
MFPRAITKVRLIAVSIVSASLGRFMSLMHCIARMRICSYLHHAEGIINTWSYVTIAPELHPQTPALHAIIDLGSNSARAVIFSCRPGYNYHLLTKSAKSCDCAKA